MSFPPRPSPPTRELTRQCQRELGQAPAALVQRLRLDDARRRLLEPNATVDLVSSADAQAAQVAS